MVLRRGVWAIVAIAVRAVWIVCEIEIDCDIPRLEESDIQVPPSRVCLAPIRPIFERQEEVMACIRRLINYKLLLTIHVESNLPIANVPSCPTCGCRHNHGICRRKPLYRQQKVILW